MKTALRPRILVLTRKPAKTNETCLVFEGMLSEGRCIRLRKIYNLTGVFRKALSATAGYHAQRLIPMCLSFSAAPIFQPSACREKALESKQIGLKVCSLYAMVHGTTYIENMEWISYSGKRGNHLFRKSICMYDISCTRVEWDFRAWKISFLIFYKVCYS